MIRKELVLKFRVFIKDKFYTSLNIGGLSIGIGVSVIILLYLQNDLTYDKFNVKYDRIYRLATHVKGPGVEFHDAQAAREMGQLLKENFPEVQSFVRFRSEDEVLVSLPDQPMTPAVEEKDFYWCDSTVFDIFTYPLLAGNPSTALKDPHCIVLNEKTATALFGNPTGALGKNLLLFDNKQNFVVSGVMKDLPSNSHMQFNALLSGMDQRPWANKNGTFNSEAIWNPDAYTYLLFPAGYHTRDFFKKFQPFYDKYVKPFGDVVSSKLWFDLEPLAWIHFHSHQEWDFPQGNIAYVHAFSLIGLFILVLACINYINMATARSGKRMKEVGLRKVFGSARGQLTGSFLTESVLLSLLSLVLSWGLVFVVLKATSFNSVIQKNLSLDLFHNPLLLTGSVGLALFVGVMAGLYPALYLPRVGIIQSIKGSFRSSSGGMNLRRLLVIIQFTVSIGVIISTLIMKDEIRYVRNKNLGFDKDHLLIVPVQDSVVQGNLEAIRNDLLKFSGILSVSDAWNVPGGSVGASVFKVESDSTMTTQAFHALFVGRDFIKTMGLILAAGRDFREILDDDKKGRSFIINETAARQLGWYNPSKKGSSLSDALDKKIMFFHGDQPGRVIGIIRDFNATSLHNPVEPEIIVPAEQEGGNFYIRVSGVNMVNTMDYIRNKWKSIDPGRPFEYYFLDQRYNESYRADERQSNLISILSGICLAVSLLGIFGLSAFTAGQRTKEICVRKVLGASGSQLIFLLFRDIMLLIVIATILASPLAWFASEKWLENFAYKTQINIFLFLITGVSALAVAFLVTGFHSLRASLLNPVDTLRYE